MYIPKRWARQDSNLQPDRYERPRAQVKKINNINSLYFCILMTNCNSFPFVCIRAFAFQIVIALRACNGASFCRRTLASCGPRIV
jgi:hypothetical protein